MDKIIFLASVCLLSASTGAYAGLKSWTAENETDPFSGGKKISVNYMSSLRSGAFIFCDTAGEGIEIRAIPGFDYVSDLASVTPEASFAIDGNRLFDATGETTQVGNNLAAVNIELNGEQARQFVKAFMTSKKQIAIKDGIADKPHLLTTAGSTKAGKALMGCVDAQKTAAAGAEAKTDDSSLKDVTLKPDAVKAILAAARQSAHDASKAAGGTDAAAQEAGEKAEKEVQKLMGPAGE